MYAGTAVDGQPSRAVLLGTHPIHLRWLAKHLEHVTDALIAALDQRVAIEGDIYWEWLQKVSSHRQPAFLATPQRLLVAAREYGFHEEYVRFDGSDSAGWFGAADDASIDEVVDVVSRYIESFPHKRDGLSLLLLDRDGDPEFSKQLASRVVRHLPDLVLDFHLATPRAMHAEIAGALAIFDDEEGRGQGLLPRFRLVLHPWDARAAFPASIPKKARSTSR